MDNGDAAHRPGVSGRRETRARRTLLFGAALLGVRSRAARTVAVLLIVEWLAWATGALLTAAPIDAHAWVVTSLMLGSLAAALRYPRRTWSRYGVAMAQVGLASLANGPNTMLPLVGAAVLALYCDPILLMVFAVGGVALSAAELGNGSELASSTWLVAECVVLAWGATRSVRELRSFATRRAVSEARASARAEREAAELDLELRLLVEAGERREASRTNEDRARFLATMAHELRTPLHAVVGFIELFGLSRLDASQRGQLDGAKTASRHMLDLIGDFLDHAKIEAGAMQIEAATFGLHDMIRDVIAVGGSLACEKGLSLTSEVAADVPVWAVGDALRTRQVVVNLLSNAVKFTSNGGVRLRVSREASAGLVVIEVADDGRGIAADHRERIFDPYRQADESTSREHGGTGLGLAISRRLARAMRGELSVDSVLGVGSTFRLVVPLVAADAPATAGTTARIAAPRKRLHVLLVDDNAVNRLVGRQLLEVLGHEVDQASNGAEAITRATAAHHDLVIMDVEMPHMDGLEATTRLRAAGYDVPIIGFTAHVGAEYSARCAAAGMNDVIYKPIDLHRLTQAIERYGGAGSLSPSASVRPPAEVSTASMLELEQLRRRVGGDVALLREVALAVAGELPPLLESFVQSATNGNAEDLRRAAHKLRGCVANVGARQLVSELKEVEERAAGGDALVSSAQIARVNAAGAQIGRELSSLPS